MEHEENHRRSRGGGRGGLGPLLEKLVSLAGQKWELGRTEMGTWQYKNVSFAGQEWEARQKIISESSTFGSVSAPFVCFLPVLVAVCHIFLFFSHLSSIFAHWQNCFAEYLDRAAWQDRIGELGLP